MFRHRRFFLVVSFVLFAIGFLRSSLTAQVVPVSSVPTQWLTDYEKSGGMKTPQYEETMAYCRKLADASPWIKVSSFGTSPEGRPLPLVIATTGKEFDAAAARKSGKTILLIQNGIHAGEIDGKDACLMLLRDIAITKVKAGLLDNVILLVIPIYNVDGHERFGKYNRINQDGPEEMGWRVTAQNLNLNRDYMKADAPETQAWLGLYTSWLPDFFIDCHVTDGADYQYTVTYSIETHQHLAEPVRKWIQSSYLPAITSGMDSSGIKLAEYIFFVDDKEPQKGLIGGTSPPRFSTSYTVAQNRAGLLIETHMLKPYRKRVEGTYAMLEQTMRILNRDHGALRQAVTEADQATVQGIPGPFPLNFDLDTKTPSKTVHFLGIRSKIEPSAISGTEKVVYTGEPFEEDIPRFDNITPSAVVTPPMSYLMPRQYQTVIKRLALHGVQMSQLAKSESLDVETYRLSNAKWQQSPYEGHHTVTYRDTLVHERRFFPAGTVVVPVHQRAAKVILHALEPKGPDSFVAWGFFDGMFEQKEYAEDYVMEKLAPGMLADDPALKAKFEAKLRSDTSFAHSPGARLQFFYRNSKYWDDEVNRYPVSRYVLPSNLTLKEFTPDEMKGH